MDRYYLLLLLFYLVLFFLSLFFLLSFFLLLFFRWSICSIFLIKTSRTDPGRNLGRNYSGLLQSRCSDFRWFLV